LGIEIFGWIYDAVETPKLGIISRKHVMLLSPFKVHHMELFRPTTKLMTVDSNLIDEAQLYSVKGEKCKAASMLAARLPPHDM
jgi:hypothetical protein